MSRRNRMSYSLILIPIIVVVLTQIIKLSIDKVKGNLSLKNIFISYGGMPSAHTAFATSLTTIVGVHEGLISAAFAICLIFTLIIMRDAATFRNLLGKQGKLLNHLIDRLPESEQKNLPEFVERVGHSNAEVLVGAVWGVVATLILNLFF